MSIDTPSHRSRRAHVSKRNPNDLGNKHIDARLSPYHWSLFQLIQACGSLTRHQVVELGLEALCLQMIVSGEISEKAYCATRMDWWKREDEERAANEDVDAREPGKGD